RRDRRRGERRPGRGRRGPRPRARARRALGRRADPRPRGARAGPAPGRRDPSASRSGEDRRVGLMLALLLAGVLSREPPLHVFLRGGPKTHGPNQHEHERFVAEWKELLASRGAVVEGALRFPTEEELARTDVLVIYAADGGSIHGDDRAHLES